MRRRWCNIRVVKGFRFLLILGLLPGLAFAGGPGEAALVFLERVRDGKLNQEPGGDTALQASTTEGKLDLIQRGLKRLGEELRGAELEVGKVKDDGDFAAVMVRKVAGYDSSEIRIYPVAMVKRGAEWLPAPVLASFENAVAGYTLPVRERLASLEDWMTKQRVTDLEALIAESSMRTRERIRESIVGEELEGDDLGVVARGFLKACAARDRAAILGYLGGLGEPLPEDWASRLAVSRAAVEGRGPWRLLVSPDVVRVPVHEERASRTGMVSIACLDPAIGGTSGTMEKIRVIHIELQKDTAGQWRMDLPGTLMTGDEEWLADDDGLDVDLLDLFPKRLREMEPQAGEVTARAAVDGVIRSLKSGSLQELLRRVDFGKRGKDGRVACAAAARIWWSINEPGELRLPLELGFKEEGDAAVAVFQWFEVSAADSFKPTTLFFRKSGESWVWCPGVVSGDEEESHKSLWEWAKSNEPEWRLSWRKELMKPGTPLAALDFSRVATDAEVEGLMADWMGALEHKDIRLALSLSAWLGVGDGEIPMKALRNLSFDITNFSNGDWKVQGVHRSSSWAVASVRQVVDGNVSNAFVPVVITGSGPRLIPEIDIFAEDNRTRNFLNEASFNRLAKFAGKERTDELRTLFDSFRKARRN